MFVNLFDSHTHTINSPDGHDTCEKNVLAAMAAGLGGIACTDHCEIDEWIKDQYEPRTKKAIKDAVEMREKYRGRLDVAIGIEMGQVFADETLANNVLADYRYDFVIGSVHRMPDLPDPYWLDYGALSQPEMDVLLNAYFDAILHLIGWGKFDILGHITFPWRSAKKNSNVSINVDRYFDRIEDILRRVIQLGKGIEINTSGLRGPLGDIMPPRRVIRRFRELGGELITIGSDAHYSVDIGKGIQNAMEILQGEGYEYFAFYRDHKPVMLRLI